MTTSGTTTFDLSGGSLLLEAFDRIEVRPTDITREQMASGLRSLNLELAALSNTVPNFWKVELVTIPLVQGTATYTFDEDVQAVLDGYSTLVQSGQPNTDYIMVSIGRSEYASYVNKESQGRPTVFWYERLITPQVTLFQVPDGVSATEVSFYVMKRIQDANNTSAQTLDIPYRFLEAVTANVAVRLAVKYAKSMLAVLQPLAEKAMMEAKTEDQERAALNITPVVGSYYP